jgi:hypothetical protein
LPHLQLSTLQGPSATFEVSWQALFSKVVLPFWATQAALRLPKPTETADRPRDLEVLDKGAYRAAHLAKVPNDFIEWHMQSRRSRLGPSGAVWTFGFLPVSHLEDRRQRWEAEGVQAHFDVFHQRNNPLKVKRCGVTSHSATVSFQVDEIHYLCIICPILHLKPSILLAVPNCRCNHCQAVVLASSAPHCACTSDHDDARKDFQQAPDQEVHNNVPSVSAQDAMPATPDTPVAKQRPRNRVERLLVSVSPLRAVMRRVEVPGVHHFWAMLTSISNAFLVSWAYR